VTVSIGAPSAAIVTTEFGVKFAPCTGNVLTDASTKRMHCVSGTSVPGVCAWAAAGAKTAPTVAAVAAAYSERFKEMPPRILVVALEASVLCRVPPRPTRQDGTEVLVPIPGERVTSIVS